LTHQQALCTCVHLHNDIFAPNYFPFHHILLTIKMYFFDCIQRGQWRCVRRSETWYGSICFWNKIHLPPPPTLFLILKLFIRCLLVGVREGLGVGISLSYKCKQIGVFFRRIVYVYELHLKRAI
jgi:hypothetical protein